MFFVVVIGHFLFCSVPLISITGFALMFICLQQKQKCGRRNWFHLSVLYIFIRFGVFVLKIQFAILPSPAIDWHLIWWLSLRSLLATNKMCNPKEIFIIVAGNNNFLSVELDVLLLLLLYSHYFVLLMIARLLYVQVKWVHSDGAASKLIHWVDWKYSLTWCRTGWRAIFASHTHDPGCWRDCEV